MGCQLLKRTILEGGQINIYLAGEVLDRKKKKKNNCPLPIHINFRTLVGFFGGVT
ncbi:hypothetical protein HanRHA438_Chr04g0179531 [Helianthus annuus]|nr:hypothetical protein HanRHA438_Chr04g0179531 [Helianthus annuus]